MDRLVAQVHPLAIGNVHRTLQLIKQLASKLLDLHLVKDRDSKKVTEALTTRFYSHLHMINRHEAREILTAEQVVYASSEQERALDELLRAYSDKFELRKPFVMAGYLQNEAEAEVRFIGATIESRQWSYLYETKAKISQHTKLPPNVQIQLPVGQRIPLLPGLPREFNVDLIAQGWMHNKEPLGVTV